MLGGLGLARIAGVVLAPGGASHPTFVLMAKDLTGIAVFVVAFW
jgi:hypothetical protein